MQEIVLTVVSVSLLVFVCFIFYKHNKVKRINSYLEQISTVIEKTLGEDSKKLHIKINIEISGE